MEVTGIWEEIERSESYLVCSMYEEAESLSSSILKKIFSTIKDSSNESLSDDNQLHDMVESTGMVLVQSLHGLGRTAEIVNEIREAFGDISAIPVQILITGICLEISNGSYTSVHEILQEFFSIWVYKENHYILKNDGLNAKRFHGKVDLDIDVYMEVVELYTFGVLTNMELAISWVEKASLPEESRQGLLRRLHSVLSLRTVNVPEEEEDSVVNVNESLVIEKKNEVDSFVKLYKQQEQSSHLISIKIGKTQYNMSKRKVAMLSLVGFIIGYALKKKRAAFLRIIRRQMESTKKAVLDFWKLAFSYQVNPLAAIQSIPTTTT